MGLVARVAPLGLLVLLIFAAQAPAAGTQEATCETGPVTAGSGSSDWRRTSLDAGPVGVLEHPLSHMSRTANGQLVTKMPALVESQAPVTLSVPQRLRDRVFIYYGFHQGRDGRRSTSLDGPGFSEVVFHPCTDKPRTIWPGGIRIKGTQSVRLLVETEASPRPIPLVLGRPRVFPRT
ncbi:MAG TPA: hypothetical protein VGF09_04735 [Solirubrobacterales bacterium]|jgi:hypothetical protein